MKDPAMKVNLEVPYETVMGLLIMATEGGGSKHWLRTATWQSKLHPEMRSELVLSDCYCTPISLRETTVLLHENEDAGEDAVALTPERMARGFRAMAEDGYGHELGRILADEADEEDADIWLQCAAYGMPMFGQ
jgi:hypothetical protein